MSCRRPQGPVWSGATKKDLDLFHVALVHQQTSWSLTDEDTKDTKDNNIITPKNDRPRDSHPPVPRRNIPPPPKTIDLLLLLLDHLNTHHRRHPLPPNPRRRRPPRDRRRGPHPRLVLGLHPAHLARHRLRHLCDARRHRIVGGEHRAEPAAVGAGGGDCVVGAGGEFGVWVHVA